MKNDNLYISDSIIYVGADDASIDLFESQYKVPHGVSYNSYVIKDELTAVMDAVDMRCAAEWLMNVESALDGNSPDYFVILHMEPDHSGCARLLIDKYPNMKIVSNEKTFSFLKQFFGLEKDGRFISVKEGDKLSLGTHELTFVMAPMVHWPEAMVAYESSERVLFSADAFGKFGTLALAPETEPEKWLPEARRYFINIVGKYGTQVQMLLKKAAALDISVICPLHGPILKDNLGFYIDKYNTWSSYVPEEKGILIAYASIHGNTAKAAIELGEMLESRGQHVVLKDLTRCDMAEAMGEAFMYDRLVLAASSYDASVFPPMEHFLLKLKAKNYQNRTVGVVENGTWAPSAAKEIKKYIETMKNINLCENTVTIKSSVSEESRTQMNALADELSV